MLPVIAVFGGGGHNGDALTEVSASEDGDSAPLLRRVGLVGLGVAGESGVADDSLSWLWTYDFECYR